MDAKELTDRLIKNLELASILEASARSPRDVVGMAKGAPGNMGSFAATASISLGMPLLKGTIGQLINFLHIHKELEIIKESDSIASQYANATDLRDIIEVTIAKVMNGGFVAFGAEQSSATMLKGILDNIHSDVSRLYLAYDQQNK